MLECPNCGKISSRVQFKGWTLCVKGVAEIDNNGVIKSVGPLTSSIAIKKGHELDGKLTEIICTACGYTNSRIKFALVKTCYLTGNRAVDELKTPFGVVSFSADVADKIKDIFTEDNAKWEFKLENNNV